MSENCEIIEQDHVDTSENTSKFSSVRGELLENFRRDFLSEPMILIDKLNVARKISSDPNFGYKINYDDLCGPWSCPQTLAYQRYDIPLVPKICSWIFIEETDMVYMRKFQYNRESILTLIGNKLPDNILFSGMNKEIFLQLMWEVFRFTRDNNYTEISISSLLGLFYFTHRYFLTTSKRTAAETYAFFKEGVLLHSVLVCLRYCLLHPPKSAEIFTPMESKQSLDFFWTVYMRQLALLRFVCLPNYRLILTIERGSPQPREKEDEDEVIKKSRESKN